MAVEGRHCFTVTQIERNSSTGAETRTLIGIYSAESSAKAQAQEIVHDLQKQTGYKIDTFPESTISDTYSVMVDVQKIESASSVSQIEIEVKRQDILNDVTRAADNESDYFEAGHNGKEPLPKDKRAIRFQSSLKFTAAKGIFHIRPQNSPDNLRRRRKSRRQRLKSGQTGTKSDPNDSVELSSSLDDSLDSNRSLSELKSVDLSQKSAGEDQDPISNAAKKFLNQQQFSFGLIVKDGTNENNEAFIQLSPTSFFKNEAAKDPSSIPLLGGALHPNSDKNDAITRKPLIPAKDNPVKSTEGKIWAKERRGQGQDRPIVGILKKGRPTAPTSSIVSKKGTRGLAKVVKRKPIRPQY